MLNPNDWEVDDEGNVTYVGDSKMNDPRPIKQTWWEKFTSIVAFKVGGIPVLLFVVIGAAAVGAWVWYERIYGPF